MVITAILYHCREEYYQSRMKQQEVELENLMDERNKLLMLQDQLQRLHEALPQVK